MATATFVHDGNSIDYTPSGNVASGDVIVQGDLIGIAKLDMTAGTLGALAVTGVFSFATDDFSDWSIGDKAYWSHLDLWVAPTDGGGAFKYLGKCVGLDTANERALVRLSQ